ncbi:MAG: C1 family peptidase [Bacteroidia bacterium]|nr:C1 family peptidase [Bacteroidia bacterium]
MMNKPDSRAFLSIYTLCLAFLLLGSSILTPSLKAQEYSTGCVLNPDLYAQVPLAASLLRGDYENLPANISLRPYAPVPQNQGAYGTCVGWSTAYAARTILMAHRQSWTNQVLITENAFSPFFIYEQAKSVSDIHCQEGTSLFNALEIIKNIGVVRISEFASQCGEMVTSDHEEKAQKFRIKDYMRLFETDAPQKALLVKKSLSEYKPVIIGIQCCAESFLNAKGLEFWKLQSGDNPNPNGGHALTVVGYDDNKYGGAFELMNSWGTVWGDEGFIWMTYDDFERYCFEAYEMSIHESALNELAGEIQLQLSAGESMKTYFKQNGYYETHQGYRSGTLFRLHIGNHAPAYIYAFGSDLAKMIIASFPNRRK